MGVVVPVVIGACARVFARPLLLLPAVPVVDLLGGSVVEVELATGVSVGGTVLGGGSSPLIRRISRINAPL